MIHLIVFQWKVKSIADDIMIDLVEFLSHNLFADCLICLFHFPFHLPLHCLFYGLLSIVAQSPVNLQSAERRHSGLRGQTTNQLFF
jgi:hypothetical protein